MPEIQDINEFKNDLIRLGNEPEIREQRGESLPRITVPESEPVDDISALFDEDSLEAESPVEDDLFGETEDSFDEFPSEFPGEAPAASEEDDSGDLEDTGLDFEDDFNLPAGLTEGLSEELDEGADEESEDMFSGFEDLESLPDDEDILPEVEEPADDFDIPGVEEDIFSTDELDAVPGAEDETAGEDFSDFDFDNADAGPGDFNPDDTDTSLPDFEEEADSGLSDFDDLDSGLTDLDLDEADAELADFEAGEPDSGISDFDLDEADSELEDFDAAEPEAVPADSEIMDFDTDEIDSFDFEEEAEIPADTDEAAGADEGFGDEEISDFEGGDDDDFSLEDFSLGDLEGDDIEATEFSLGDLGEEFGVDAEVETDIGHLENLEVPSGGSDEDFGDAYSDENYAIPDDEYLDLKKTLGQMPRNLKLIIEELIGEKGLTGENLDKLVKALVAGSGAREIGAIVSKITGKKIKIPAQYERKTAQEFEKEKDSFSYIFRKNFIPMFRTAALAAVILGVALFLGYRFVYKPLHAESLYKKGYDEIPAANVQQANAYFDEAFSEWPKKSWFYRYAESFIEYKQYIPAEEKYKQLLAWYPDERDAVLDYAELEFKILGKYPEAEKLLKGLLFDKIRDYDARLMLGDTYMEWAREIDPSKYEDARFNYAKLIEQYGGRDELLFRMLRYFIRTDNYDEAMKLYRAFRQNDKVVVEPDVYAELAGYLIDHGQLDDVREILMKARSVKEDFPEIHYELARYFDKIDIPVEEEKALNAAIWLFENTSPLTRTRKGLLIDSYNRYGTVLYKQEKYIDAENFFEKAASNYDEALAAGQIEPEPKYGEIFSNLGDLSYYISGDYDLALTNYEKAEANKFAPPILKYKRGYIHYSKGEYRDALVEFYDTAEGFSVDRDLLYATANTLFNRNDFFLAEGYYTHLLDMLNKEYSSINYLLIDEIPEHRALVENLMKVCNNLGVTKYRLYERSRDAEKNAEAMVLFTDSVEYYDKLARDPNSLEEPETVNLSYLNSRAVFFPMPDYKLQIYQDIPKDLSKLNF